MLGAHYLGSGKCTFKVWTPNSQSVSIKITTPDERDIALDAQKRGYWQRSVEDIKPGSRYYYRLNGQTDRPDPASNFQPEGIYGPSAVTDHNSFSWSDENWKPVALEKIVIYELHVGTFTPQGSFEAIIDRLDDLVELGVNAIELMPVTQFPGERNWGYDGVFPFAVQNSYGGPEGLKRLVNACHKHNLAVILDVVYNHLGPEGNILSEFGPYFTDKYKTPWGNAINFNGKYSDQVRNFFISNAIFWLQQYHIDALRLDALHAIYDTSAKPFIRELAEKVEDFSNQSGRKHYLIGESDLNDVKIIQSKQTGGYGLDAQWCDDFHHSLHTFIINERGGYYADFGKMSHLVKSYNEGFVYSGQYSKHRKRRHGSSSKDIHACKFVVFSQNHDQIGNRMLGERLSKLASFEALKLAAGAILFSPYIPLLFMGQEYGEESPFLYFTSHKDPSLVSAVREGRKNEFKAFGWAGQIPDPQAVETFHKSKIKWENRKSDKHKMLLGFYKCLIKLRKETPALSNLSKKDLRAYNVDDNKLIVLHRWYDNNQIICFMNFDKQDINFTTDIPEGRWVKFIDSAEENRGGNGSMLPGFIEQKQSLNVPALSFAAFKLTLDPNEKKA